jgi:hypothetical protein
MSGHELQGRVLLVSALLVLSMGCSPVVQPKEQVVEQAAPTVTEAAEAPGTWRDPVSGLMWQVTPTGEGMEWDSAVAHCSSLTLAGGGWRLPEIGELRPLIRGCPATMTGGSCNVQLGACLEWSCLDSSCDGCSSGGGPASGCYWSSEMQGPCDWYWSSSAVGDIGDRWSVSFGFGQVSNVPVNLSVPYVRCVR